MKGLFHHTFHRRIYIIQAVLILTLYPASRYPKSFNPLAYTIFIHIDLSLKVNTLLVYMEGISKDPLPLGTVVSGSAYTKLALCVCVCKYLCDAQLLKSQYRFMDYVNALDILVWNNV